MKHYQDKKIWLDEFDDLYNYHNPDWTQDKSTLLNAEIIKAVRQNKPIPPITFAADSLLNHLDSELEYEISRMERRIKKESSGAAQYFRSTYPKHICSMFVRCLYLADTDKIHNRINRAMAPQVYGLTASFLQKFL